MVTPFPWRPQHQSVLLAFVWLGFISSGAGHSASHRWSPDLYRHPGKPPPPPPGSGSSSPSDTVPYPLVDPAFPSPAPAGGNHSSWSPKFANGTSDSDAYVLGVSHNPWGLGFPSTVEVPEHLLDQLVNVSASALDSASNHSHRSRSRRSVVHLYNMIVCATGCNPMAFKGYGCYCGFLGSGYTVDGIDRCCKMHDWCYNTANCPMFSEYFVPYLWKCYQHRPICGISSQGSSCSQRLCECDRRLAECLRRYPCPRQKAVCTSSPWRLLQNLFML